MKMKRVNFYKLAIKVTYDVLSVCDTTMLGKRNFEPLLQDLSL